jgi:hypothetical protein
MRPCPSRVRLAAFVFVAAFAAHAAAAEAARKLTGAVAMRDGRPTILIDGKPELPMIYALTDFRGGRWTWEEIPRRNLQLFTELGFRLFQVDVWLQDLWPEKGPLDVDLVRKQLRGVLDVNPRAALFLRFHVNAPFWWNRAHPDETVRFADGPTDDKEYGPPFQLHYKDTDRAQRHSLASLKWRDDVSAKTHELLRKLVRAPEADALVGIQIAGGVYGEWHPWGFPPHDPDVGPAMTRYFRDWLRAKYGSDEKLRAAWADANVTLATAAVPDLATRDRTTAGLFRDPARERQAMDYYEAQQDTVADAILHFTKLVKATWPRPIITGAFYGYYFSTFGRQAAGAHLRMERVFSSPEIDYVSAPQSYYGAAHDFGGTGQSRGLAESARLHGKLYLDEMDTGTHIKRPADGYEPDNPKEEQAFRDDVALLRRNTLHPIARGMGLWFYDFGAVFSSGHWDHPRFHDELRRLRGIAAAHAKSYAPTADALFVFDTEYLYGFKNRWNPINENLIDRLPALAYRSGVAFDTVLLSDLPKVDLSRYKAVVFANALQMTAEQRTFVRERVARGGRHVVFAYLPGYSDGQRLDEKFSIEVTGIRQKRVRWAGKGDPKIVVDAPGFPRASFTLEDPVEPMTVVDDAAAQPIGRAEGTNQVVIARKKLGDATSWLGTLSLHEPQLLREIFRDAGCHVYDDGGDSVIAGSGLVIIHSLTGGDRTIRLRNGKAVPTKLPPRSTTVFDAESGASLLPGDAVTN